MCQFDMIFFLGNINHFLEKHGLLGEIIFGEDPAGQISTLIKVGPPMVIIISLALLRPLIYFVSINIFRSQNSIV